MKKNKKANSSVAKLYKCVYYKNFNGQGGVAITKEDLQKIRIGEFDELFALDKDEVDVVLHQDNSEVLTGTIVDIVKHNTFNLIGYIQKFKNQLLLKVAKNRFGNYLVKINSKIDNFDRDQIYNFIIKEYPSIDNPYFVVELNSKILDVSEDEIYLDNLLAESGLPCKFNDEINLFIKNLSNKIKKKDLLDRIDLRDLNFVTIDGKDAKDFDDALYCETCVDGFKLYVAIADVSHYVKEDDLLDKEALLRGNSVYLPKMVVPMLPEKLSNNLCSLKPNEDRLVLCCEMNINFSGIVTEYNIYNGVINSKSRLTYDVVQQWLNELSFCPQNLIENISNLFLVYKSLIKNKKLRGAINLELAEPSFIFDKNNNIIDLQVVNRLESHKIIEECMLAANVSVADFLVKHQLPCLFRIHDKPSQEKFKKLKDFLNSIAIKFDISYEHLTSKDMDDLLEKTSDNINFAIIQQEVLRSMQLAIYTTENIGHFGLSYKNYLHFTSPIRRYPDLVIHRVLKNYLNKKKLSLSDNNLTSIASHTSFTERRAESLERKMSSFYKCQLAQKYIDKEYSGIITSVVNFGVFVYLPDIMIDGLIHVSELGKDYFVFDDKLQVLVGKRSGVKYNGGQNVFVIIDKVDMNQLLISFKLIV